MRDYDKRTQKELIKEQRSYLENKAKLYMLRCLVDEGRLFYFLSKCDYDYEIVAEFIGFDTICESEDKKDKKDCRHKIRQFCLNKLENLQKSKLGQHKVLEHNLNLLQKSLNLNPVEVACVELVVLREEVRAFEDFIEAYEKVGYRENTLMISQMLDCDFRDVSMAIHKDSVLRKMGILDSYRNRYSFEDRSFLDILLSEYGDKSSFVKNFVTTCDKTALSKSDYAYIKEFDLLTQYLKTALSKRKSGVNILIYGVAGTGKTELAKLLAQSVNAKLHKVKTTNDEEVEDGIGRISSYLFAQKFLEPSENIVLYDEVEDILNSDKAERRLKNKAFLNEILETNAVATIWITNNIYSIDNAIIRRFDLVLEAKMPKKDIKEQILLKICGDKLDKKAFKFALKAPNLAPAVIERACEVSLMLGGDFSSHFITLIKNTLKAQGLSDFSLFKSKKKKRKKCKNIELPQSYSLEFVNTNCDLKAVVKGIKANKNARICLYGVSGTGKSAFAKYLAKELNCPCIIKSVSDLESCYVGSTEENIAKAFKEAKKQGAVLVFDEVDSFLRDRNTAIRGFEASKVNEMLTQMEKFDGIFIATTNLMDMLDKAALRRFDLKLEFKALNVKQRVKLFKKECELLKLVDKGESAKISRLEFLSAGDFAAVKRQMKFAPIKNANDFYERLCKEVQVKDLQGLNSRVGFIA